MKDDYNASVKEKMDSDCFRDLKAKVLELIRQWRFKAKETMTFNDYDEGVIEGYKRCIAHLDGVFRPWKFKGAAAKIITINRHRTFNRYWVQYDDNHYFQWVDGEDILFSMPYAEEGQSCEVMRRDDYETR
jgi:hypothetical protein